MQSVKMERIIGKLTTNYFPFNLLSQERIFEVANLVRFIEMKEGEIFQITGGTGHDYLFVVEGRLELIQRGQVKSISGPKETRVRPLVLLSKPNTSTLVAKEDAIICHADREMLDKLISWDEVVHITEDIDEELKERIDSVRNSLVFKRLPMECVEEAFKKMKSRQVKKGEEIIKQGEDGDAYFVITKGTAEVFQMGLYDDEPRLISELTDGDAFGDEALVTGKTRSETVHMTSDGELLVLYKEDFGELISKEFVKTVNAKIAKTMLETGYELIDVRYSEEYDEEHIPDANLLPLYELRDRMNELDVSKKYIAYCHSGSRSAVAVMMLNQNKFD
ncbi:MAG: cyclic nucleotide-binding domain-containing protein, partial [Methylococcales bacterium]|nr:cyclic nucleotide-binding domain-containing protein [Methylococcales bacterium]